MPTEESLAGIAETLLLPRLPSFQVELAREAQYFGVWFAGLGPDYDSRRHILGLNKFGHQEGLPDSLVLVTYGFDEICDCLDKESSDDPDQMEIVQVQVGFGELESRAVFAPNFEQYLVRIVELFGEERRSRGEDSARFHQT